MRGTASMSPSYPKTILSFETVWSNSRSPRGWASRARANPHVSCFSYLYKNEIQSIDRQAFKGLSSLEQL